MDDIINYLKRRGRELKFNLYTQPVDHARRRIGIELRKMANQEWLKFGSQEHRQLLLDYAQELDPPYWVIGR